MNQILITEKKKKKSRKNTGGPLEIKSIVRIFAIFIAIFGIALAGGASYALYTDIDRTNPENIPNVYTYRNGDTVKLKVEHNIEISKVKYKWNDGQENVIPEGTTYAEEEIILPDGNNVLHITVIDMKNREYEYEEEYLLEGVDITKPNINVVQTEEGTANVTINVTDETSLAEMSYKINDEQEVIVQATEEGQTEIQEPITLPEGQNVLTVIAKDGAGNTTTFEKEIIVSSKPSIEIVSRDGSKLTLKISDKTGLQSIKINLNGKEYNAENINQTEVYVPLELQSGNNVLSIEVININGLTGVASTQLQQ